MLQKHTSRCHRCHHPKHPNSEALRDLPMAESKSPLGLQAGSDPFALGCDVGHPAEAAAGWFAKSELENSKLAGKPPFSLQKVDTMRSWVPLPCLIIKIYPLVDMNSPIECSKSSTNKGWFIARHVYQRAYLSFYPLIGRFWLDEWGCKHTN